MNYVFVYNIASKDTIFFGLCKMILGLLLLLIVTEKVIFGSLDFFL